MVYATDEPVMPLFISIKSQMKALFWKHKELLNASMFIFSDFR